jgi:hypothetical protein
MNGNINNPNNPYVIGIVFQPGWHQPDEIVTFSTRNQFNNASKSIDNEAPNHFIPVEPLIQERMI